MWSFYNSICHHYSYVIMGAMASGITSVSIVYTTVCSGAVQRKHQKLRVTGSCEGNSLVNSPHKGPVKRKMFPFDDVIMWRNDWVWPSYAMWLVRSGSSLAQPMACFVTARKPLLDSMMTSSNGNIFRVTGHLCGEFAGARWIPHTKASDAGLWCFLWSASE